MKDDSQPIDLTVVLPAYREAEALGTLLPLLIGAVSELTPRHEILVVDAQRKVDDTLDVCSRNRVRHVFRRHGNFYGDAVRTGIEEARGEYILFMDADGSHNPAQIASLWKYRREFDVVVGSRYVKGGMTENPKILIFMSWVVNVTFRTFFHLDCKDVTNSFRLYRGTRLRAITLRADNFDIVEEVLIRICSGRRAGKLKEVPVTFERRKAGESKRNLTAFALSYVWTLLWLLKVKYRASRSTLEQ
jgi:dolichol-phosphate mannosyltransferase